MRNLLARQDVKKNAPFGAFFICTHQYTYPSKSRTASPAVALWFKPHLVLLILKCSSVY